MAEEKKENRKESSSEKPSEERAHEKGFLVDAAENIEAGARLVGEKTSEIASDITGAASNLADSLIEKVRKGKEKALDVGSEALDSVTETAQSYAEKYKDRFEVAKLKKEQEELYLDLGKTVFEKSQIMNVPPKNLLRQKEVKGLYDNVNQNIRKIISLGEELEQSK